MPGIVALMKWKMHAGEHNHEPAKWKASAGKCKSGFRALIFCELDRVQQSPSFALKSEKNSSISLFMKATIPGTHGIFTS